MSRRSAESDEFRMKLISMIRDEPILWDKETRMANSISKNREEWEKISSALNISVQKARRVWESLRDQYRRELKLKLNGRNPKWRFFDSMSFTEKNMRGSSYIKVIEKENKSKQQQQKIKLRKILPKKIGELSSLISSKTANQNIEQQQKDELEKVTKKTHPSNDLMVKIEIDDSDDLNESDVELDKTENSNSMLTLSDEITVEKNISNEFLEFDNIEAASVSLKQNVTSSQTNIIPQIQPVANTIIHQALQHSALQQQKQQQIQQDQEDSHHNREDEDYHFAMSILSSLRQVPRSAKLFLRMKIMNCIADELNAK